VIEDGSSSSGSSAVAKSSARPHRARPQRGGAASSVAATSSTRPHRARPQRASYEDVDVVEEDEDQTPLKKRKVTLTCAIPDCRDPARDEEYLSGYSKAKLKTFEIKCELHTAWEFEDNIHEILMIGRLGDDDYDEIMANSGWMKVTMVIRRMTRSRWDKLLPITKENLATVVAVFSMYNLFLDHSTCAATPAAAKFVSLEDLDEFSPVDDEIIKMIEEYVEMWESGSIIYPFCFKFDYTGHKGFIMVVRKDKVGPLPQLVCTYGCNFERITDVCTNETPFNRLKLALDQVASISIVDKLACSTLIILQG
jgi:hypothetical protein